MIFLKQSTPITLVLGPFVDSTDGRTPKTALTIAQADVRLRKNGGAWAQKSDTSTATHDENGFYRITLNGTDTATLGVFRVAVAKATALPVSVEYTVVPANVYESLVTGSEYLSATAMQADVTASGGLLTVKKTDGSTTQYTRLTSRLPLAGRIVASSAGGTLNLQAVAARTTGIAPLYVHFDASATTSTRTSRPFHEILYQWDFGDTGAGTWSKGLKAGGASKNADSGPITGHIFETGGTYTVTCTAFDGVVTATKTVTVTVTAANSATEFLTNKTVVVNNVGDADFTDAPAGATQVNTNSLQTALASLTGSVKRIMFKRGGTWDTTAVITKNLAGPIQICSYGSGALPKWRLTSTYTNATAGDAVLKIGAQSTFTAGDLRVFDIEIDGSLVADPKVLWGFFVMGTCDQITIMRMTYRSLTIGVNFSLDLLDINQASWPGQRVWDQLAIVDCLHLDPPNRAGGGGSANIPYGDFFSGERYLYAGNDVDLGGLTATANTASHCVRSTYTYKGSIKHNTLANPGHSTAQRHHIKAHGPVWTESSLGAGDWAPVATQVATTQGGGAGYTRYLHIADNKCTSNDLNPGGWYISAQPQGSVPSNYSRNKDQIIERNWCVANINFLAAVMVQAEQCTIRNNITTMTGANVHTAYAAHLQSAAAGWICEDVWIYNNSSYHNDGASGEFAIQIFAGVTGAVIKNNLAYAPGDTTGGVLTNAGTGTVSANNSTDSQMRITDPKFSGALTAYTGWRITDPTSYTRVAGASVPVWDDLFGTARAAGTADIGASQQ